MDSLPNEIIIEIFRYFDIKFLHSSIAMVCTRWRELSKTPCLYSHLSLENEKDLLFLNRLPTSHHIRFIEITYQVDLINSLLEQLAVLCPRLTSLTINNHNLLSERHIIRVSRCFPKLMHLNVFLISHFISQTFLTAVQNIDSIVLNNHIDDTTLKTIANTCTNLKELHMYGNVKYYPLCHLHTLLLLKYEHLSKMSLRCCEVNNRTCELIANCTSLKQLYMYHCWLITDIGMMKLSTIKNLSSLHLTGLKLVSQKGFQHFIEAFDMKCLLDLNLSCTPFSDTIVQNLLEKKLHLRRLELWQCKKLTLTGIVCVVRGLKSLLTLDLDMELPQCIIDEIILSSDIKFLRCSSCKAFEFTNVCDRKITISDAFGYFNELCFRGNGEGYSANLVCYSNHFDHLGLKESRQNYNKQIDYRPTSLQYQSFLHNS